MTKTYKLLIDSPEYAKNTEARWNETGGEYDLYFPNGDAINSTDGRYGAWMHKSQIENRPEFWQLQEEKLDLRSPEAERMREESMATRFDFVPKKDERIFWYDADVNEAYESYYSGRYGNDWINGFIKRTREECKAHGEKYARYFLTE